MPHMLAWELTATPDEADVTRVTEGVLTHGRALAVGGNTLPLACFARHRGELVAGGSGRTEFNRLFISFVWVAEVSRGQGIGTEIIKRMEVQAREVGCTSALIETLNDRVAQLYKRLGYNATATVTNYVGPFTRHIMIKTLGLAHAESEA